METIEARLGHLPPLVRINEILPVVPIKRATVWLWVRQGRFPQPVKRGGFTWWRRDDICAWLQELEGPANG